MRRAPRRRAGLFVSIALHLTVLGVAVRVHWPTEPMPVTPALARAVWVTEWPDVAVAPPPTEAPELLVNSVLPVPDGAAPPIAPRRVPKADRPATTRAPAPRTASPVDEPAPAPTIEDERASRPRPQVDWEKERRDAVRSVIAERQGPRHYLAFSLAERANETPAPIEPAPAPFVDDCVIAQGRLQVFMAQMMGRCVREARGDLFAAIMPDYLTTRPVCVETHPDSPGSVLRDGTEISTVKCELVARTERR
jgi:hypothetical protein